MRHGKCHTASGQPSSAVSCTTQNVEIRSRATFCIYMCQHRLQFMWLFSCMACALLTPVCVLPLLQTKVASKARHPHWGETFKLPIMVQSSSIVPFYSSFCVPPAVPS